MHRGHSRNQTNAAPHPHCSHPYQTQLPGVSHTFFVGANDKPRAGELINVLREAKQVGAVANMRLRGCAVPPFSAAEGRAGGRLGYGTRSSTHSGGAAGAGAGRHTSLHHVSETHRGMPALGGV